MKVKKKWLNIFIVQNWDLEYYSNPKEYFLIYIGLTYKKV